MTTLLYTVLGSGVGMTTVLGIYDRVRNRRFDRRKQDSSIKLDDAQYEDIAARAEQTSSTNLMAVGAFWQGQFNSIQEQLEAERDWRKVMTPKLRAHKQWDDHVAVVLRECDMDVGPPPSLDPDD